VFASKKVQEQARRAEKGKAGTWRWCLWGTTGCLLLLKMSRNSKEMEEKGRASETFRETIERRKKEGNHLPSEKLGVKEGRLAPMPLRRCGDW